MPLPAFLPYHDKEATGCVRLALVTLRHANQGKESMAEPILLVEKSGPVATVTLNRPNRMNALSGQLRRELAIAIEALEGDETTNVIILTGAGERAFCAGLDLKELGQSEESALASVDGGEVPDPVRALDRFTGPVIGAINGVAITGGFEIALACDVLFASPNAMFADTHAHVGIMPGWGLSQKLARCIGLYRAKELSLTGNFLTAEKAYEWGLVNRIVPADELLYACQQLAQDMSSIEPAFLKQYLALIDEGYSRTLSEGMEMERRTSGAANIAVSGAEVEARRLAVMERGRGQTETD